MGSIRIQVAIPFRQQVHLGWRIGTPNRNELWSHDVNRVGLCLGWCVLQWFFDFRRFGYWLSPSFSMLPKGSRQRFVYGAVILSFSVCLGKAKQGSRGGGIQNPFRLFIMLVMSCDQCGSMMLRVLLDLLASFKTHELASATLALHLIQLHDCLTGFICPAPSLATNNLHGHLHPAMQNNVRPTLLVPTTENGRWEFSITRQ